MQRRGRHLWWMKRTTVGSRAANKCAARDTKRDNRSIAHRERGWRRLPSGSSWTSTSWQFGGYLALPLRNLRAPCDECRVAVTTASRTTRPERPGALPAGLAAVDFGRRVVFARVEVEETKTPALCLVARRIPVLGPFVPGTKMGTSRCTAAPPGSIFGGRARVKRARNSCHVLVHAAPSDSPLQCAFSTSSSL